MNIIDKVQVKHYHRSRLEHSKDDLLFSQGWTSEDAQKARFDVILGGINFNGLSVLDVGCGCGDLKAALDKRFADFDYIGLDMQDEFVAAAKERFKEDDKTWFHSVDFSLCELPAVDVVVACGALSYRSENEDYYLKMIEKFYAAANKVFVFNMLDEKGFESGPLLVSHDRQYYYERCMSICDDVVLRNDYMSSDELNGGGVSSEGVNSDFTIFMKK